MSNAAAEQFLLGGGNSAAFGKDDPVGTTVTGTIVSTEVRQQTDIASGAPLTWDNGDPRMQLVVTIQTSQRNGDDDDGQRAIYVKGSKKPGSRSLHDAVATAVRQAGAKGIEPGGTLTVKFVGTEPSATRGFNDRKLWEATYVKPDAAAATGGFLGTEQGPVDTTTGEIQQQPPAAAPAADVGPAQPTAEQLAAVRAANLDPRAVYPHWNGQG